MQEPGDSGGRRAQRPGPFMNWIQIPGIVRHSLLPTRLASEVGYFCSAVFMPILRNVYGGQSSPNTFTLALTQTKGKRTTERSQWTAFWSSRHKLQRLLVFFLHQTYPPHIWWLLLHTDTSFSTVLLSPSKDPSLTSPSRCKMKAQGSSFSFVLFIVSFKHNLWNIYYVPHSLPSIRNTIVN